MVRRMPVSINCAGRSNDVNAVEGLPPERPGFSVRAAIALIVVLLSLYVLLLAVSTYQARRNAERAAFDRAAAASMVVATNAKWIDELAWQALRHIDDALGPDIADGRGQTVRDIRAAVNSLP